MSIDIKYLNYKIKDLPVARVVEVPEPFDWFGVWSAMDFNYIKTKSKKGYVGLIFPDKFLLIRSFLGAGEVPFVGIADELSEELKMQMHYMGLYYGSEGFQVSDSDVDVIPRTDLKFDPYSWYERYAKDGLVVFVKYSEKEE
jgi:hypothetical protein|nr:MAG TPA: hypothetical protein [Caudoviricetes sp.]